MILRAIRLALLFSTVLLPLAPASHALAEKIPWAVPDLQDEQTPDATRLSGWIGQRMDGNEKVRLLNIDIDRRLLDCYRNRPGKQTWAGEHVGKWLHAATLAWVNSGDPALRAKLDFVVAELIKCQLPDGYLGTYEPEKHWTAWDLWSHKYNLIGFITYMRYTGDQTPMEACRKMADLICKTYGDGPGQRTINTGPHKGLAYSSVMEPMAELYRLTGEPRYLEFCQYVLRAWETEQGPKIISGLLTLKQVNKVANGKAYELLSCLNSVLEVYRTIGDRQLLDACLNAWNDIEENRIYITGTASYRELFRDDHDLPNSNNVGETCVTVTWIQFSAQLLRLTGEARFAQEIERVVLNQLIGSQAPNCDGWGYYVQLEGKKPYGTAILGHCCLSSGPRGLAMIPMFAASTDGDGAVVNLYESGETRLKLRDRREVALKTETGYPADGRIRITVTPGAAHTDSGFAVKLRIPAWSPGAPIQVNGEPQSAAVGPDGYVALRRDWKAGDVIELNLKLEPRVAVGTHTNAGKAAFLYGPLVLAADDALLSPDMPADLRRLVFTATDPVAAGFTVEPAVGPWKTWPGAQVFRIHAGQRETIGDTSRVVPRDIRLVPFAETGGFGSRYKVWVPLASAASDNVSLEGDAALSGTPRDGSPGSIVDGELLTSVQNSSGDTAGAQAFTVSFRQPIEVRRVAFVHGQNLRNNGWFDTEAGKPVVEVQAAAGGPWIKVGELADYPATTSTDGSAFKREQKEGLEVSTADIQRVAESRTFTLVLPRAQTAVAVRVTGKTARGVKPGPYVADCAELRVFVR